MKISIVTPSYNQGHYLDQTIDSVLSQNYPDLEYIIIDGGSSDNSVEIIKKYSKHLKFWVSEKDKGQSHAINKGIQHCTGDVFNWINSDDYYYPDAFENIIAAFSENSQVQVVGGKERSFIDFSNETIKVFEGTQFDGDINELIYEGIIDQPPTFWKMDMVRKLGPLPEDIHYTMDSFWWMKYLLMNGLNGTKKINDFITNFRIHNESKSSSFQDKFNSNRAFLRKLISDEFNFSDEITEYFKKISFNENSSIQFDCMPHCSVDLDKLEAYFAYKVYPRYYIDKENEVARKLHAKAFKKYKTLKTTIDFIKLQMLPEKLLKLARG
jgi:glycosyltransferase involved in cell wall biosynthesis